MSRHSRLMLLCGLVLLIPLTNPFPLQAQPLTGTRIPDYPQHLVLNEYRDEEGRPFPIKSPANWEIRRKHILYHFQRVAGMMPPRVYLVPLDVQVEEVAAVGTLTRKKLTFATGPKNRVPAYLFLPATAGKKSPAMLCLHQTTSIGKQEPAGIGGSPNMHYAIELAQRGFVTLVPDYPSLGDYQCDFTDKTFASGTLQAVWDNLRAVDFLQSLPEVDGERIGVIGHSLGGHNAIFTAIFDPRLKALVSSCGFCRFHKDDVPSWNGPRYMPRIGREFHDSADEMPFDFPELIAALAPRHVFVNATTRDNDFDVVGVRETIEYARPIYKLLKVPERLVLVTPDAPHDFPPETRQQAYQFLEQVLKP